MQRPETTSKDLGPLKVLSVSPLDNDHVTLQSIIGHSKWKLSSADSVPGALTILRQESISVVVCERELVSGIWTDLLDRINEIPCPPSIIVTSEFADERLWAEALNRGACDVLAKPFDRMEVLRCVKAAWQHWYDQFHRPAGALRVMGVAS